jgi:hypothetical protein
VVAVTSPPLPLSVAGVAVVALMLAACSDGGDDPAEGAPAPISDPTLATALAEGAERLGDQLAAGQPCEAIEEAELLHARSREGTEVGALSPAIAREIEGVAAALIRDLTCEPEAAEPDREAAEPDPDTDPEPEPTRAPSSGGDRGDGESGNADTSSGGGGNSGDRGNDGEKREKNEKNEKSEGPGNSGNSSGRPGNSEHPGNSGKAKGKDR